MLPDTVKARNSTWSNSDYSLIDFGQGRKLEQFGSIVLDRPCPAADHDVRLLPQVWETANVVLGSLGEIIRGTPPTLPWQIQFQQLQFQLALTPFGHVGLFPEQADNWRWLADRVGTNYSGPTVSPSPSALNLFGYTGAATLILAAAGCKVVHVDASAPSVAWARKNAELNGLSRSPIRWIVDDARKFIARELRRGNRYDIVVLDPPSYGHGSSGKRWELERDLPEILKQCAQLLDADKSIVLVSCHTHGVTQSAISNWLECGLADSQFWRCETRRLAEPDSSGRTLDFGMVVRGEIQQRSSL